MRLPIVYHDDYVAPLPAGHRFPMKKFALLYELLVKDELAEKENTFMPEKIEESLLKSVHEPDFVDSYKHGHLGNKEIRKIGIPWSEKIVNRTLTALGGSLLTAELALKYGIACNSAGGTHHAFGGYGSGFCIFNDLALVSLIIKRKNLAKKILIIDLDVHQGDGTAAMLKDEPDVFSLSVHSANNFPFVKQKSDHDIPLKDGVEDEEYLNILDENIPSLLEELKPDFVIYDAGVDIYKKDPLGRLGISYEGIRKRDKKIIETCVSRGIPISCVIGGGYSADITELAYRHSILHRTAHEIYCARGLY